jgi:hypothetical protein
MSDALAERFAGLKEPEAKNYPGKRKPALRQPKRKTVEEAPGWDADPVYYVVKGEKREFFTLRHLAAALDYSQQSIRAWENSNLLPRSGLRSPRPRTPTIGGKNTKGKRLWTRAQIEGILRIAEEEGVIVNKVPPTRAFARKVSAFFKSTKSV